MHTTAGKRPQGRSEARQRLVPSQTTLLGLVKHVTYVEGIWFDQAITGRSTADIGIECTSTFTRSGSSKYTAWSLSQDGSVRSASGARQGRYDAWSWRTIS
jgi:hypothetical protein